MDWIPIVVALVGGGAAGAIITQVVGWYRSRQQPITYEVSLFSLFGKLDTERLPIDVSITHGTSRYQYDDLGVCEVTIRNTGNMDRPSFKFGVTLPEGLKGVSIVQSRTDRFHNLLAQPDVTPEAPQVMIDLEAVPFNRKDVYRFRIVCAPDDSIPDRPEMFLDQEVTIETAEPVRLVRALETAALTATFGRVAVQAILGSLTR